MSFICDYIWEDFYFNPKLTYNHRSSYIIDHVNTLAYKIE